MVDVLVKSTTTFCWHLCFHWGLLHLQYFSVSIFICSGATCFCKFYNVSICFIHTALRPNLKQNVQQSSEASTASIRKLLDRSLQTRFHWEQVRVQLVLHHHREPCAPFLLQHRNLPNLWTWHDANHLSVSGVYWFFLSFEIGIILTCCLWPLDCNKSLRACQNECLLTGSLVLLLCHAQEEQGPKNWPTDSSFTFSVQN